MQDLSGMVPGLSGGASMAAGSTLTGPPVMAAPGSPSEQSADVAVHDAPELTVPATWTPGNRVDAAGAPGGTWTTVTGVTRGD